LLASYTIERRPVTQATVGEAVLNYHRIVDGTAFEAMEDRTPEAEVRRREIGDRLVDGAKKSWLPLGIHLGYSYASSSIVNDDPGIFRYFDPHEYEPSITAGARAPHAWLTADKSTLDLFGRSHVLVRCGAAREHGDTLVTTAASVGMPLAVEDVSGTEVEAI